MQANDFEAYQELLREQGAKETQGERYEVITKFLNDTEEYLHKLAGKVSNVKLQQEASEAFTKATAEARAMVSSSFLSSPAKFLEACVSILRAPLQGL